jgi:hypothetical protein
MLLTMGLDAHRRAAWNQTITLTARELMSQKCCLLFVLSAIAKHCKLMTLHDYITMND